MKARSIWLSSILLLLAIYILPYFLYYKYLGSKQISQSLSDWGNFGDFIGGVSSSSLTLINILIFIFLTYRLIGIEDKRNEKQIEIQKKILVSSLRNEAIKNIYGVFEPLNQELFSQDKINASTVMNMRMQLIFNVSASAHLFEGLMENDTYLTLLKEIEGLYNEVLEFSKTKSNFTKLADELVAVSGKRAYLISYLQSFMIADLKN